MRQIQDGLKTDLEIYFIDDEMAVPRCAAGDSMAVVTGSIS
jgi:hypothetical protein